jgi:hypothetical protein
MKILHILKSAPDATTKKIIEIQAVGNQSATTDLTGGPVNYDALVSAIFDNDKVICW